MQALKGTLVAVAALAMIVGAAANLAAQESSSASGELLNVDADAQILVIRTAEGSEQQFAYDEETQVTGAQEGVAGLASMTGATVTVQFAAAEEGKIPLATRIQVQSGQ